MVVEVHAAYLLASLSFLFGVTYTVGMFLDKQTKRIIVQRQSRRSSDINAMAWKA